MYWTEFLTIAAAHLFAVASPGPDFAVVLRQSLRAGTKVGVWTSLGVGSGILLHVAYCLLGVALLLTQIPTLFNVMKLVAAAYLFFLGAQSLRASLKSADAGEMETQAAESSAVRAFVIGFLTNGLNPKATLFFLALFTVVIDPGTPLTIQVLYGLYLAFATFLWFSMLSFVLGIAGVREFILRAGAWIERGMGVVLIALALQIAITAA